MLLRRASFSTNALVSGLLRIMGLFLHVCSVSGLESSAIYTVPADAQGGGFAMTGGVSLLTITVASRLDCATYCHNSNDLCNGFNLLNTGAKKTCDMRRIVRLSDRQLTPTVNSMYYELKNINLPSDADLNVHFAFKVNSSIFIGHGSQISTLDRSTVPYNATNSSLLSSIFNGLASDVIYALSETVDTKDLVYFVTSGAKVISYLYSNHQFVLRDTLRPLSSSLTDGGSVGSDIEDVSGNVQPTAALAWTGSDSGIHYFGATALYRPSPTPRRVDTGTANWNKVQNIWRGLSSPDVSAAVEIDSSSALFFKGSQFYLYDVNSASVSLTGNVTFS